MFFSNVFVVVVVFYLVFFLFFFIVCLFVCLGFWVGFFYFGKEICNMLRHLVYLRTHNWKCLHN